MCHWARTVGEGYLVVRDGRYRARAVVTAADPAEVRVPRVNDRRIADETRERRRFSSKILGRWRPGRAGDRSGMNSGGGPATAFEIIRPCRMTMQSRTRCRPAPANPAVLKCLARDQTG